MKLRTQLAAVSLLLLSLPWAGCQYLREMESTLLTGQSMATQATADAIAAALREREDLLYPTARRAADPDSEWYLPSAARPLFADGYDDDWRDQPDLETLSGTPPALQLRAAARDGRLFLLLQVRDSELRYRRPGPDNIPNGDRLLLQCLDDLGARSRFTISGEGPGEVRGLTTAAVADTLARSIRGALRESATGYTLELSLPLDARCQRLHLNLIDAAASGDTVVFDSRDRFGDSAPWLVYQVGDLNRWLRAFATSGRGIRVRDRHGWIVGSIARPAQEPSADDVFWLWRVLVRAALRDPEALTTAADSPAAERPDPMIWRELPATDQARQLEARGIIEDAGGQPIGDVLIRETTERYLALTDRASTRVLGVGVLVVVIAFLGLLGYASLLSWRIRRLSRAAAATDARELSAAEFPASHAGDELGELSRSYAHLLTQVSQYNRYLQGLAQTLSHELRTPIAVIRSSLDHLANPQASIDDKTIYRERAASGLARLSRIVTAMSEASRIEESVRGATLAELELGDFLKQLRRAYGATFAQHRFPEQEDAPQLRVPANGELLAQALDKLVENAVSFAPANSEIHLRLAASPGGAQITVSNSGPLLPDALRERLFEPLVSQRAARGDGQTHLGLGLGIARAIARAHGGNLSGENLSDGSGVVFSLTLTRDNRKSPR